MPRARRGVSAPRPREAKAGAGAGGRGAPPAVRVLHPEVVIERLHAAVRVEQRVDLHLREELLVHLRRQGGHLRHQRPARRPHLLHRAQPMPPARGLRSASGAAVRPGRVRARILPVGRRVGAGSRCRGRRRLTTHAGPAAVGRGSRTTTTTGGEAGEPPRSVEDRTCFKVRGRTQRPSQRAQGGPPPGQRGPSDHTRSVLKTKII